MYMFAKGIASTIFRLDLGPNDFLIYIIYYMEYKNKTN